MSEHTPGPWLIAFGGHETDDYAVIGSKYSDRAICNLEPMDFVPANARLIAAAPELLEALQKIDSNAAESVEWIRRVAREAIAKATGE